MRRFNYHLMQTPVGWIALLSRGKGLVRLSLKPTPQEALEELGPEVDQADNDPSSFEEVLGCLERYMEGDAGALDEIELDLSDAPPFFGRAWAACRRIPAGETRSYAWLADAAGSPLAVRAAGQAMARNRFVLIVPCHRVIASDGALRGYGAGGLTVKADLLERERAAAAQRA
jgi:methylated-DNA-[protein]-cysteine S-methyltransferase